MEKNTQSKKPIANICLWVYQTIFDAIETRMHCECQTYTSTALPISATKQPYIHTHPYQTAIHRIYSRAAQIVSFVCIELDSFIFAFTHHTIPVVCIIAAFGKHMWIHFLYIAYIHTHTHIYMPMDNIRAWFTLFDTIIINLSYAVEFFARCSISHNPTFVQSGASACNIIHVEI